MIQRTMKPKQLSLVDLCAAFVERRWNEFQWNYVEWQ